MEISWNYFKQYIPGVLICAVIALAPTVLSTMAMVLYPVFVQLVGLSPVQAGIFLGGTIHDVAQVVAAGMILGKDAGDVATVVNLFRVVLLMPVVLLIAFVYRNSVARWCLVIAISAAGVKTSFEDLS